MISLLSTTRRRRPNREAGFTLIELMVVALILGILTAIALPAFLAQQQRGRDANAKADARNLVSHIGACYEEVDGYLGCQAALTSASTGLPMGSGLGQVEITAGTATAYTIVAHSRAASGGVQHNFTIDYDQATATQHDCTVRGSGGCPADGDW